MPKVKTSNFLLFCLLLVACFTAPLSAQPQLSLSAVNADGLNAPLQLVHAGDGTNRFFVVQKGGDILVYDAAFDFLDNFLSVSNLGGGFEGGLLSMAFHPAYSSNGFFYVYYTSVSNDLELARYRVSSTNPNHADPDSKVILLTIPHADVNYHNGGELHFGQDAYLYLSTGDGSIAGDPGNHAQNKDLLLGKILRFNVDTSSVAPYYTIPADNPFGNEVFALGLRNPFRWSFDRLTQDIWIGDVGSSLREEINFLPAGTAPGANFGWSCFEGEVSLNTSFCHPDSITTTPAFAYYSLPPVSVIGGLVYRGTEYPSLQGYYFAADHYSGNWYLITPDGNGGWNTDIQNLQLKGIADFGESESGEIFVVSINENQIYKLGLSSSSSNQAEKAPITQVKIYPNLIQGGALHLDYQGVLSCSLQLYNLTGAQLFSHTLDAHEGNITLQLPNLPSGIYYLILREKSGHSVAKKVVVGQ